MKNVFLISNVTRGGKTYLEYLIPALNALRGKFNCTVLQTDKTGLSKHEAEEILNYPVKEVGVDFISSMESQIIISNDAWIGRILDDSNFGIFIAHGNVGMPTNDKYYYSELTSYWDAIVSSSRSGFDLIKAGLQLYRRDRKALQVRIADGISLRSDLRKTSAISTLPVKIPDIFGSPPDVTKTSKEYVVGLLPTQIGICPSGASLLENLQTIINAVTAQIPRAKFILRPYMADLVNPYVKEMCEQLSQYPWISVDTAGKSSKEFYQQCDTVITDASTGGVSFMLNTCKLPIYYVPAVDESNPIIQAWLEQMDGLLPIAKNSDELKDLVLGLELLTPEENYLIYNKFYTAQYSELHHPNEVFQDLVQNKHESIFCQFMLDSFGRVNENPKSVLALS